MPEVCFVLDVEFVGGNLGIQLRFLLTHVVLLDLFLDVFQPVNHFQFQRLLFAVFIQVKRRLRHLFLIQISPTDNFVQERGLVLGLEEIVL